MKNRIIFGVSGQLGSGKDTVGQIIKEHFNFNDKNIVGFADGVKKCAQEFLNINTETRSRKSRYAWQSIGDVFREIYLNLHGNKNIWIDYLFKSFNDDEAYVICDVRYKNEMQRILDEGGLVIYINVSETTRRKRTNLRRGLEVSDEEWLKMNSHETEYDVRPDIFKNNIFPDLEPKNKVIIIDNNLNNIKDLTEKIVKTLIL